MTLWTVGILTILLLLIVKKNLRSSGQGKIFKPVQTRDVRLGHVLLEIWINRLRMIYVTEILIAPHTNASDYIVTCSVTLGIVH